MRFSESEDRVIFQQAQALAGTVFGNKVSKIEWIPLGVMTHKFKVELNDGEAYVIRFYPPSRGNVVDYEPDLIGNCLEAGVPVPKVIADSRSGPSVGLSYMMYRWISGTSMHERLSDLTQSETGLIASELVSNICKMAKVQVTGYGELLNATRGRYPTLRDFLEATLHEAKNSTGGRGLWDGKSMEILVSFCRECVLLEEGNDPVLGLGDLSPEHILFNESLKIVGLLDFEGVIAGTLPLTLGYLYARYPRSNFYTAVRKAWPSQNGVDRSVKLYALIRGFRLSRFENQSMPTGHPRDRLEQILPGFTEVIREVLNGN